MHMTTNIPLSIEIILSNADCAGEVSEELISLVEKQHSLHFPPEYRVFLEKYGAAILTDAEIYGIVEKNASPDDEPPIWIDLRGLLKKIDFEKMPHGLVPISDNGGDYTFYLKCALDGDDVAGSVVAYGPGIDGKPIARDFFEFLECATHQGVESLISS